MVFFFFFVKNKRELLFFFFFQAEDGIRDLYVTEVQTCALPISCTRAASEKGSASTASTARSVSPIPDRRRLARSTAPHALTPVAAFPAFPTSSRLFSAT